MCVTLPAGAIFRRPCYDFSLFFSVRESNAVKEDGSNRTSPRVVVGSVTRPLQGAVSRPRLGATKGSTKGGTKGWTRGGDKVKFRAGAKALKGCVRLYDVCVCMRLSVHVSCCLCVCM